MNLMTIIELRCLAEQIEYLYKSPYDFDDLIEQTKQAYKDLAESMSLYEINDGDLGGNE